MVKGNMAFQRVSDSPGELDRSTLHSFVMFDAYGFCQRGNINMFSGQEMRGSFKKISCC